MDVYPNVRWDGRIESDFKEYCTTDRVFVGRICPVSGQMLRGVLAFGTIDCPHVLYPMEAWRRRGDDEGLEHGKVVT